MCGIAGIVHLDGSPYSPDTDRPRLEAMASALRHRGPDDQQVLTWNNVGIAFNRLSIVDLEHGHQPFHTPDGEISAVVNGEIYNHAELRGAFDPGVFQSRSDCEVIPHLYRSRERAMFDDINGMFAMALLDRGKRRIWLARDRLGIKPLFHCRTLDGNSLLFASEIKGLLAHPDAPREFDWEAALARHRTLDLRGRELPSYFRGIERVPAGSVLEIALDRRETQAFRYWSLDEVGRIEDSDASDESEYVEAFRELLADSVQKRTMGDVPFGIFLSGGVDSAAITALAATGGVDFSAFTSLGRSSLGNGDAEAALSVAEFSNVALHSVQIDGGASAVSPDDWRRILWSCEMYDIGGEQLHKYALHQFAKTVSPELKFILLGQGSDEFTGGYLHTLIGDGPWEEKHWPVLDRQLRRDHLTRRAAERGFFLQFQDLIRSGVISPDFAETLARGQDPLPSSTWDRYRGYFRQNLDYHLWHEDRTASAHSIENRVPFLDHRLLELLASIPARLHPKLFVDKGILRAAMREVLPAEIAERPKAEFLRGREERFTHRIMHDLIRADNDDLIEQAIQGSARTGGPLEPDSFRRHATAVGGDPSLQHGTRLLYLVNMGLLADLALSETTATRPSSSGGALARSLRSVDSPTVERMVAEMKRAQAPAVNGQLVIALAGNLSLMELHRTGSDDQGKGCFYLSKSGWIDRPTASNEWGRLLSLADGIRDLDSLIEEGRFDRESILAEVPKALARNEIAVVSRESERQSPKT